MCPAVGDAERVGRRHTWVPPYRGISKGAVKRGVGDADPYAGQGGFYKNVIPRSEATWESVFPIRQGCGGCRRGVGDAAPYESIAESAVRYQAAG